MDDALQAGTVMIEGAGGDTVEAYSARPLAEARRGGVVVIHHMPGFDAATKEIVRTFAVNGYDAVCPNLYWRVAPGADADAAAAAARAAGGKDDGELVGDVEGARQWLASLSSSNGRTGVIGYCSGGRQSFLAATHLRIDAAVVCYGAFIVGSPPAGFLRQVVPIVDRAPLVCCPVLGLFGADDSNPSPDEVAELDRALDAAGKEHTFRLYPGAGHAFFAVDRPSYRPEVAKEAWGEVWAHFGATLSGPPAES